jgi:nucleoside-diphosphate-sugar epimerase
VNDDVTKVHVVIGASGATGSALVRELVSRGRRVRAVNRSGSARVPRGVEVLAGDATDPARMRAVCRDAGVVYNVVNPPFARWREAFPAAVDGVLAGAQAAGARMVFADDTWMYGRVDGPMTEDLPSRPVSDRGVLRAWLAEKVLAAHAAGRVRTVIGRAPELYGPAVESVLGRTVFGPALSGRRALWVGELDQPLAPMYIDDFAHGLARLGEADEALGAVWHLPTPEATTARELFALVSAQVGRPLRVRRLGDRAVGAVGTVWPVAREGAQMLYQFRQPHVVDAGRYQAVLGRGQVTPYEQGVKLTLDWYRTTPATRLTGLGR